MESQLNSLKQEIEDIKSNTHLHTLNSVEDITDLPLLKMRQIHRQLNSDLERLNQVSNNVCLSSFLFNLVIMMCFIFNS